MLKKDSVRWEKLRKLNCCFDQQPPSYQRGKQNRDVEKVERLEAQRKERELKNQQALEVSICFKKFAIFVYHKLYHINVF